MEEMNSIAEDIKIDIVLQTCIDDPEGCIPTVIKYYFEQYETKSEYEHMFLSILFGKEDYNLDLIKLVEESKKFQSIWAKTLDSKDVAWKWETCELDPTWIICTEWFEKSNHEGHKVRLKRGIHGCWDWGDSTAWNPTGFWIDHSGYIDYTEEKVEELLPKGVGKRAKVLFYALGEFLHSLLLRNEYKENISPWKLKISLVINTISSWLDISPLFIYYSTKMLMRIHPYLGKTDHKWTELVYVDDEHKNEWNLQFEKKQENILDQKDEYESTWGWMLISLIFRLKNEEICTNFTYNIIFKMFQSLKFKVLLGYAYVSNYEVILEETEGQNGYYNLGVQILTIQEISRKIIQTKTLSKLYTSPYLQK